MTPAELYRIADAKDVTQRELRATVRAAAKALEAKDRELTRVDMQLAEAVGFWSGTVANLRQHLGEKGRVREGK